jgi:hypothetical protein
MQAPAPHPIGGHQTDRGPRLIALAEEIAHLTRRYQSIGMDWARSVGPRFRINHPAWLAICPASPWAGLFRHGLLGGHPQSGSRPLGAIW